MQKIEDKKLKKDVSEKIVALAGKMNIYFTEDEINDYFLEKDNEMDRSESQKVSGGKPQDLNKRIIQKLIKKEVTDLS